MSPPLLSIGAVSAATGIPVNTLRTWERRYGWPAPDRTTGHQRLYTPDVVDRLRLVARALAVGHRAAQVVHASSEELEELLGVRPPEPEPATGEGIDLWMGAVRNLEGETLQRGFRQSLASMGLVPFLEQCAGPFLVRVGHAWSIGEIQTFHEHFASEQLRDFLAAGWRPLVERARGPMVVCATLPGEAHALGLHMAASVLALEGCRMVFVGPDTPIRDLEQGVVQAGARGLFMSVSASARPEEARAGLTELRRRLPESVRMVVGGSGAPDGIPGVRVVTRLAEIPQIVAALAQ